MIDSQTRHLLNSLFTPSSPVDDRELFAGRAAELEALETACFTRGRHAVLFGERGVGKTSLALVFMKMLPAVDQDYESAKVTCDSADTYAGVLRKLLRQIRIPTTVVRSVGFDADKKLEWTPLDALVAGEMSPEDVRFMVDRVKRRLVVIVDEFDRLDGAERRRFADAIKVFSDNATNLTMVLVGVAASVNDLIDDHASVERAVTQIRVPRMSLEESVSVIDGRLPRIGIVAREGSVEMIAHLSQGLPHFVHLLGLGASLASLERADGQLNVGDVASGVRYAIKGADQSIIKGYSEAISSPRVDALYTKALCACAMAAVDAEGYFTARQVLPHMQRLHGENVTISFFMKHLNNFSQGRGKVLEQVGTRRKYRYRFRNPMMKAYVLIQAVSNQHIDAADVVYVPARRIVEPFGDDDGS